MANLKDVIYLSAEDYNTLYTNGSVTINGVTLTYDANNVYIVPDNTQEQIDDILDLIPSNASSSNKMLTADDISSWAKQSTKPSYNFSEIGSKPTTLSGYGITDANINNGAITLGSNSITPLTSHLYRPIKVNGTQKIADTVATALDLVAGSNVSLSESNGTVTISATNTTYSSKTAASGGTDVSLVTTGEKYNWNSKTSNTGTVTSVAVKMNGSTKGTVTTSGTIDLGTVLTSHQTVTTSNSTVTVSYAGGKKTASVPLRYVGSSRVPGTYFVNIDSYSISSVSLPNAIAGDALFFKRYSNTVQAAFYDGSSWTIQTIS